VNVAEIIGQLKLQSTHGCLLYSEEARKGLPHAAAPKAACKTVATGSTIWKSLTCLFSTSSTASTHERFATELVNDLRNVHLVLCIKLSLVTTMHAWILETDGASEWSLARLFTSNKV